MASCSCGIAQVDARGFAFVDHRLHGAKACARQHTFGEVIRAVADGAGDAQTVAQTLGAAPSSLVDEALARLEDAGVIARDGAKLGLAGGVSSEGEAEKKLVAGGAYHPGDLVA